MDTYDLCLTDIRVEVTEMIRGKTRYDIIIHKKGEPETTGRNEIVLDYDELEQLVCFLTDILDGDAS